MAGHSAPKNENAGAILQNRAAQYLRMSTDHQRYSTENQAAVIAQHADRRGLTIVRTYADEGKSGLSIDGRDALKHLISDVRDGQTDFTTVLVYDVSRWGRFQDADESAYYEFICKDAGITVQYCAEQFENDGSMTATVIKSMKRAMAGEYSRELSAKVFAGQCHLITLGFRQGGVAGYGLRRQLIDEQGNFKSTLSRGEHKCLQTDRVILVPGPPEEVAIVRRIYGMFVCDGKSEIEIAGILNEERRVTDRGRPWTRGIVHQILTNEKYIGNNIYNRVSRKLRSKRIVNTPDMWVRSDAAFAAVVAPDIFYAAQQTIDERSKRFSDADMLDRLAGLLADKGWLSGLVIDELEDMPSSSTYRHRFGSLLRAYHLVGYSPGRDYGYLQINRALRDMYPDILSETITSIERLGSNVDRDPVSDLLTINNEFTASIVIVRCLQTGAGALRWKIRFDAALRPDITVVLRMNETNEQVQDYYLLPRIDIGSAQIKLSEDNGVFLDAYRFESLDPFFQLTARRNVGMVA